MAECEQVFVRIEPQHVSGRSFVFGLSRTPSDRRAAGAPAYRCSVPRPHHWLRLPSIAARSVMDSLRNVIRATFRERVTTVGSANRGFSKLVYTNVTAPVNHLNTPVTHLNDGGHR